MGSVTCAPTGGVGTRLALSGGMITILLVILILMLLGALPSWPYSRGWGYYPSGTLTLVILIVLLLALSGRI
jgi:hypothetical protein